ncbi:unnamed protein product [Paramecium octaurelia]|uniref:Uncharacterized protein n=1 Tax=Paramecium octaurelia TaxID=43137 RepID=A0A8S1YAD6_PAROT|nr:unnamed protein product [Paramecium octaurelia]
MVRGEKVNRKMFSTLFLGQYKGQDENIDLICTLKRSECTIKFEQNLTLLNLLKHCKKALRRNSQLRALSQQMRIENETQYIIQWWMI